MHDNIYLTGFMGCGKSSVGKLLGIKLNRKFIDLDKKLVKRLKMPISNYFQKYGEEAFRREESILLEEISQENCLIVATGGGIIENCENRKLLKATGNWIYLKASFEDCRKRVGTEGVKKRPLWSDPQKIQELFSRREPLYSKAAIMIDTSGHDIEGVVGKIMTRLFPDENFSVRMEGIECPVVCSFHALDSVCSAVSGRKRAILTDRKVSRLHLPRYLGRLDDAVVIELAGGEKIKSLKMAEKVYKILLDNHFNRDDLLLAVGGGTVTDLGAYIASTYKRGMSFILASTTLLGSVDAAVGGKAAVNLGDAKNIIGTFTIPELVVLDANSFGSLPRGRISEGLVEAYKTGLIATPQLAALIEDNWEYMLNGDLPFLKRVAGMSAQTKAKVVSADFRESGRRAILNFGHTYGHAVEGYYKYKVSHGQSVALGMMVAAVISRRRQLLSERDCEKVLQTTLNICPDIPEPVPLDESLEIMSHDKKIRGGKLIFILLKKYGEALIVDDLKKQELKNALRDIQKYLGQSK